MHIIKAIVRVVLIIMGIFAFGLLFLISTKKNADNITASVLNGLKLHLTGIVYDVDYVDNGANHGFGIIRLTVLSSNVKEYDPRSKSKYYYCIIKNNKAEVYTDALAIERGDTITLDTEKQLIGVYGPSKYERRHDIGSISVNPDDGYYNYIKQHQQF